MKYYYNSRNTQRKQRRHVCRTFHISANLASVAISFSFVSIRTEIELLKKWMTARSRCFARKWLCGYDYQCTSVRYTTFPKPCVHTALCSEFSIFTRQNIQYFAQLCATPQENLNNPICLFRYCLYIYVHCRVRWFFSRHRNAYGDNPFDVCPVSAFFYSRPGIRYDVRFIS